MSRDMNASGMDIDALVDVSTDYLYEMSPEQGVREAIELMQRLTAFLDDTQDAGKERTVGRVAKAWGALRDIGEAVHDIADPMYNRGRFTAERMVH